MNNYQLYRTNILLGGQLKWDIVLNKVKTGTSNITELEVSDFHLSPISHNVPFTYNQDSLLLNSNHQDNVKSFYKNIKGYFYSKCLDSTFINSWPIIHTDSETPIIYSNMYDAGCKRARKFEVYNKQFEILCPVWIEKLNEDISFEFSVSNILTRNNTTQELKLSSAILKFSVDQTDTKIDYHNKFVNYFKKYISDAGLYDGNDNVINISLSNQTSSIDGFNLESGQFEIHKCYDLVKSFIELERPLIENDNLIIRTFENNKMICKQLFNFNFCLNLEDIISTTTVNNFIGSNLKISVAAKVGDKELEKRDFYTEYECIKAPKDYVIGKDQNILDYFRDYKFFDNIDKNKLCQTVCHWSAIDCENQLFNLYKGFDKSNDAILSEENIIYVENAEQFNKQISKDKAIHIKDSHYINGIKYSKLPDGDGIYLIGAVISDSSELSVISNKVNNGFVHILAANELIIIKHKDTDNFYIILTTSEKYLSLNTLKNLLDKYLKSVSTDSKDKEQYYIHLNQLNTMFNSKVLPTRIKFNKTLNYKVINGPDYKVDEIEYYIVNNSFNYVTRYDGKIKPTLKKIKSDNIPNTVYYKEKLAANDLELSIYANPNNIKYKPKYKSIGYFGIKSINNALYNKIPEDFIIESNPEYTWFDTNNFLLLKSEITASKKSKKDDNQIMSLDDAVNEIIAETYKYDKLNPKDNSEILYVKSLYNVSNNLEYESNENIENYIYNITLKLK